MYTITLSLIQLKQERMIRARVESVKWEKKQLSPMDQGQRIRWREKRSEEEESCRNQTVKGEWRMRGRKMGDGRWEKAEERTQRYGWWRTERSPQMI
jgi:hypothetical protein